jgi:3'-5' exoribonuclease
MDAKKIKEFVVEDRVEGFFVVRKKELREYTRGKYLLTELGDNSGRIDAKMWEPDRFCFEELADGMVVKVRGQVTEYNGKLEITITKIRQASDDEYDLADILAHSSQSKEHRQARLQALTDKIENTYIKLLVQSFWNDAEFLEQFLKAAAGKLWHHAYIGGLSEHSANVGELALRVAAGYDFLNKDYLIFGGLLHDAGKVQTYTSDMVLDYTDEGRLINHICLCDAWICERAHKIDGFPEKLLMKLRHMILAHQGELAYASPVVPMMPEAFVLYYCDEIDSKMGAIDRIRSRQRAAGWSEYVKMLDRFLYFEDLPEDK